MYLLDIKDETRKLDARWRDICDYRPDLTRDLWDPSHFRCELRIAPTGTPRWVILIREQEISRFGSVHEAIRALKRLMREELETLSLRAIPVSEEGVTYDYRK